MTKIKPHIIQKLLSEIKSLKESILTEGNEKRDKLKSINLEEAMKGIPLANEEFDPDKWSLIPEPEQHQLYKRLTSVQDMMKAAAGLDGPKDPKHIMSAEYASTRGIIALTIVSFLFTFGLLYFIVLNWEKATGFDLSSRIEKSIEVLNQLDTLKQRQLEVSAGKESLRDMIKKSVNDSIQQSKLQYNLDSLTLDGNRFSVEQQEISKQLNALMLELVEALRKGGTTEESVLTMVILLGMLGGMLHFIRSLVMFVGNRQFKRSWILYYLSMPITGGGLALLIYILLRVGLLNPSTETGDSMTNLNLVAIYAFAGLTGLFAKTALDKLSEVFSTIFHTDSHSKDSLGTEKPSEGK